MDLFLVLSGDHVLIEREYTGSESKFSGYLCGKNWDEVLLPCWRDVGMFFRWTAAWRHVTLDNIPCQKCRHTVRLITSGSADD